MLRAVDQNTTLGLELFSVLSNQNIRTVNDQLRGLIEKFQTVDNKN